MRCLILRADGCALEMVADVRKVGGEVLLNLQQLENAGDVTLSQRTEKGYKFDIT